MSPTLPQYVGGGAEVSPLAYALVRDSLGGHALTLSESAERHGVDEADVLRALAELKEKGVLVE